MPKEVCFTPGEIAAMILKAELAATTTEEIELDVPGMPWQELMKLEFVEGGDS